MVFVIALIARVLKLGFLVRFISNAVMTGFINGIAIKIILSQLRGAFDLELPLRTIFETPALRSLADEIDRGALGDVDAEDLERDDVKGTDILGKAGVERSYDDILRGSEGAIEYQVDAKRKVLSLAGENPPGAGGSLILTIDADGACAADWVTAAG